MFSVTDVSLSSCDAGSDGTVAVAVAVFVCIATGLIIGFVLYG